MTLSNERQAMFTSGPTFFKKDGKEWFVYVIDGGNKIGPREVTDEDKEKYPEAYKAIKEAPAEADIPVPEPEEPEARVQARKSEEKKKKVEAKEDEKAKAPPPRK